MANEPGVRSSKTYQPGEMPLPIKHRPGLRIMHQEMNSEAASFSSQLRGAVPPKRAKVEKEDQRNEMMEYFSERGDQLERIREKLARTHQDRDRWKKLFEDANRRQEEEIARLKRAQRTFGAPQTT